MLDRSSVCRTVPMCVTPEMAREWLKNNQQNRSVRRMVVECYKREMLAGRWKLTHQGVAFDEQMNLLDGQHRLMAISESGISVWMMVSFNVESSARLVIDDHAKRDYADSIRLGLGVVNIDSRIVGVLRMLVENVCTKPTKSELAAVLNTCSEPIEMFSELIHTKDRGCASAPTCAALVAAWFYVPDLDRLERFASYLKHGMPPGYAEQDKAASIARDRLTSGKWSLFGRLERRDTNKKVQAAIKAFVANQSVISPAKTACYPWPCDDARALRGGDKAGEKQRAIFHAKEAT